MSDPFTFMLSLIECLGSLHTIDRYEPFEFWRESVIIFMAIFGIVWKYRLELFFKKNKKVKKIKKKMKNYKKREAKKVYAKRTYAKKAYSTKSFSKIKKRKVTFKDE